MTTAAATLLCPACAVPLTGGPACTSCQLRLVGPEAQRLWQVDQALLALDGQRGQLLAERGHLLAVLRGALDPGTAGSLIASPVLAPPASALPTALPVAQPRPEWTPKKVQNTLLGIGALLLAVAATVFAAVTYDRLGAGGRAAVLVALTALALGVVPPLLRKGLTASAETATGVALALGALDAYGLRTLGIGDDLELTTFAAIASGVLAAASAAWAAAFPVRLARTAAVVLAQLPVVLLLARHDATAGTTGLVLAALCAADLAATHLLRRTSVPRDVGVIALVVGMLVAVVGLVAATAGALGAFSTSTGAGALALVCFAALAAGAAVVVTEATGRWLLAAVPVPLLGLAAFALVREELTGTQQPLVAAAVGLLGAQLAALLPRQWRAGSMAGALVVTGVGVAAQLEPLLEAVAGPFSWLADPWSLSAGATAREAVTSGAGALSGADAGWSGSVVTLVVLLAAAATLVTAAAAVHRLEQALAPAAALVVASAVLLPLGLATSYAAALVLLLAVGALLAAAGAVLIGRPATGGARVGLGLPPLPAPTGLALVVAGLVATAVATLWSLASETATLAVLPTVTVLLAGLSAAVVRDARLRDLSAALSGVLSGGALAAVGASRDLAVEQVGGLLLTAVAVLLGLSWVVRRVPLEVAAASVAAVAVVLTTPDAGWLSWSLVVTGLLALAVALRPDRRWVAGAGALLIAASSWVRLADAGVEAPEPYVVPLGLVALALGHLRRRAEPATSSMAAYSAGLGLLLVPSLLACLGDDDLLRPVLLLVAAAGVLVTGVAGRLRAPLLFGGAVVAVDAVQLLGPYAAALPRWMPLAAVGLALVTLGATYEQRRRDVSALRDRLDAFA